MKALLELRGRLVACSHVPSKQGRLQPIIDRYNALLKDREKVRSGFKAGHGMRLGSLVERRRRNEQDLAALEATS